MTKEVSPRASGRGRRGERLTNCASARRGQHPYNAFTLIELVLVVGIITVLSALLLSTVGYARKKGARARAETEMAAMSAACENYKADNGVYPNSTGAGGTDGLDPLTTNLTNYENPCRYMYGEISGDRDFNGTPDTNARPYMAFKDSSL